MVSAVESPSVYTDLSGLNSISQLGRENTPAAMMQVAKQFESVFLNMMIKSMRDSTKSFSEGNYLHSNEMDFHQQNYDNQLSLHLSESSGIGLADVLYEQMMGQFGVRPEKAAANDAAAPEVAMTLPTATHANHIRQAMTFPSHKVATVRIPPAVAAVESDPQSERTALENLAIESPQDFVRRLYPMAEKAASRIGVDPRVLIAQSALETGWGKRMIARPDGGSTFNLFGIKADSRWQGEQATIKTTEYQDGVVKLDNARFRSYDSYEQSFDDYVEFLQSNPRYQDALSNTHDAESFARHLQDAGYATDPVYARKITRVMNSRTMESGMRDIGNTAN